MTATNFNGRGESIARAVTSVLAWGSWLAVGGLFAYATFQFNPAEGKFAPQWVGFAFIGLIGVAIAAGAARGRHKLSDTITDAFRAGLIAQEVRAEEIKDAINNNPPQDVPETDESAP